MCGFLFAEKTSLGGTLSTEAEIRRYFPSPPAPLPEGEGRKNIRENLCFSTYHFLLNDDNLLFGLSFISLGELYRWPLTKHWGNQRLREYEEALKTYVVLWCDDTTCRWWAKVSAIKGRPMPVNDSWIAATALRHDTPLVTHNVKDFAHLQPLGLKLITASIA